MSSRVMNGTLGSVLVLTAALLALPACNKKKPTEPANDTSPPVDFKGANPGKTSGPVPGGGNQGTNQGGPPISTAANPLIRGINPQARQRSQNNLKQIALAFHINADVTGTMPVGIADSTGNPGLSWRVAILPYIEQNNLYKQFKLNEPWDSEHNKKLIGSMPSTYAAPSGPADGKTYYQSFSGKDAVLHVTRTGTAAGSVIPGLKIFEIPDGTSNTLLVAEAAVPVIWTKPEDMPFTPGKPPSVGGIFEDGFNAAFCDGSVRFLTRSLSTNTLSDLIQINDGRQVNIP
jgi:prepilin-type processing-associated H-X9-DG protein